MHGATFMYIFQKMIIIECIRCSGLLASHTILCVPLMIKEWRIHVFFLRSSAVRKHIIIEPPRGKTNNVVFEQIRHKPACTATEAG